MPKFLKEMGDCAFMGCSSLDSITLPNSLTEIPSFLFSGCINLTCVNLPNTLVSFKSYTFEGCKNLATLTIPESVTNLGWRIFEKCENLAELKSLNPIPPTCSAMDLTSKQYESVIVYVPIGSGGLYKSASQWEKFSNIVEDGTLDIKSVSIEKNNKLKIYNINGNRLKVPKRGINIINGKKIMVK